MSQEQNTHQEDYELTVVQVYDKPTDRYCVFFAEIPEAIAQGRTEDEALQLLVPIAKYALEERKEEGLKHYLANFRFTTHPYKLVHA